MNYPIWDVPMIGSTWIIGLISCIHIFISHFAVGGGLYFALSEWLAYKNNDHELYAYLKKHSLFFLILTSVSGAITGVGIWWAISLVNPNGTATLIQTYTLGWAEEYLFFVAELATFFVYYYTWNRLPRKTHLNLAIYYAVFSVMTLVIINGILTFMLTPGQWLESRNWLDGFFNETYWPSLLIRLVMMMAVAGMYALLTSAKISSQQEAFRTRMLRYSAKWFLPIFILGPILAYWFFLNVPGDVINTIQTGLQTSGVGNFSILARATYLSLILSGTLLIFAYVGPYLNPKGFTFRMALVFLLFGLVVTGITEWTREMLRKPYVVYGYMYSNGIRKEDVAKLNETGFIQASKWSPKTGLSTHQIGREMFKAQCMSCHTVSGYRGIQKLLGQRDEKAIGSFLALLHETDPDKNPYLGIMPPVVGTQAELDALASYLASINKPQRTVP